MELAAGYRGYTARIGSPICLLAEPDPITAKGSFGIFLGHNLRSEPCMLRRGRRRAPTRGRPRATFGSGTGRAERPPLKALAQRKNAQSPGPLRQRKCDYRTGG
jgi:hypothetical protein